MRLSCSRLKYSLGIWLKHILTLRQQFPQNTLQSQIIQCPLLVSASAADHLISPPATEIHVSEALRDGCTVHRHDQNLLHSGNPKTTTPSK